MPAINGTSYTSLYQYAILAQAGVTSAANVTIENGLYYGNNGSPSSNTGTFLPLGSENNILAGAAAGALGTGSTPPAGTLLGDISIYTNSFAPSNKINLGTTYGVGTLNISANTLYTSSALTFNGTTINFQTGGNKYAQFFIKSASAIIFTDVTIKVDGADPATKTNDFYPSNIFWISYSAITCTTSTPMYGNFISTNATITFASALTINGNVFVAATGQVTFGANTTITSAISPRGPVPGPVVCYAKGTKILTKNGFMSIENIKTDDNVITGGKIINNEYYLKDDFKLEPVTWISKFKVNRIAKESAPICISKHSLAKGFPLSDLYVSPCHGILWKGAIVRAKDLINGETIFQDFSNDSIVYYHLELESHSALIANGILSESYLELDNRQVFETPKKKYKVVKKSIKN